MVPDLIEGTDHLVGLLNDKSFAGPEFTETLADRGSQTSSHRPKSDARACRPGCKVIAEWRNRIETTLGELTETMNLTRHGAHTFHGLLTRTAATIAAHTMIKTSLPMGLNPQNAPEPTTPSRSLPTTRSDADRSLAGRTPATTTTRNRGAPQNAPRRRLNPVRPPAYAENAPKQDGTPVPRS